MTFSNKNQIPDVSPYFCDEIVEIISNANEEFYLFFIKMPVLSGIGAFND
jgi:hypothetical protein